MTQLHIPMHAVAALNLSSSAAEAADGLLAEEKRLPSPYLYDDVGVSLFSILAHLPGYGIKRAEERLFRRYSQEIIRLVGSASFSDDLGDGSPIARMILRAKLEPKSTVLQASTAHGPDSFLQSSSFYARAQDVLANRPVGQPLLIAIHGGSVGNLDRSNFSAFLKQLRSVMSRGDFLLFSVDLVKDPAKLIHEYDDEAGIAAAFNRNVLSRVNRDLGARFDLHKFQHAVLWNGFLKRVELRLLSTESQQVFLSTLGVRVPFRSGETILTQSFYKYSELELEALAASADFRQIKTWVDAEWALAETLWQA